MPCDNLNCYYMPGGYGQRTITHMSRMAYSRSANSTAMYARPYGTADSLIQRVNQQGEDWYHNEANDLHLRNFIWFAWTQTAQRMWDQGTRVRNIDQVLDRLLVEGIFDREEPNMRSAAKEMSMAHSAAMVHRLLMRIKSLEHRVCLSYSLISASIDHPSSSTRPTNYSKVWNNVCLPTVLPRTASMSSCTSMGNRWRTSRPIWVFSITRSWR